MWLRVYWPDLLHHPVNGLAAIKVRAFDATYFPIFFMANFRVSVHPTLKKLTRRIKKGRR
jgi:hypothetical protein